MPTIAEVAEKAGVSASTVSHVINKTRYVSAEVTEQVLAAMDELGYRPNALARSLRRGETLTLGMILPDSANPFFAEIGHAIENEAFRKNYSMILCNTDGDPQKEAMYAEVLSNKQVDGMIFVATGEKSDTVQTLQRHNLPLVLVDRQLHEVEADTVLANNQQGGALVAEYLTALGHRRLGCITGPSLLTLSAERVTGFQEALQARGLMDKPVLLERGDFHPSSGYQAALRLLQSEARPTAIFACNDMMAIGVYRAAAQLGLRIPEDLAVVGFDDIELSSYLTPPLTTVAQPKAEIGQTAVSLLLERIGARDLPARRVVLETRLVVRESSGGNL
jgi:LacI family transcriptional regulator